jgi:hypothetical protein
VEDGETTLGEKWPGKVERTANRLTTADRNDLGARCQGVEPFGRGSHAGTYDRDPVGVLVRLVGVDRTLAGLEPGGD